MPVAMKCFERLLSHIKVITPTDLDNHHFVYPENRPVKDAVSVALHITDQLEHPNTYARMLGC